MRCWSFLLQADYDLISGNQGGAKQALREAVHLARVLSQPELNWEIHHRFGRYYGEQRQPRLALHHLTAAMDCVHGIWETLPVELRNRYLEAPERVALRDDFRAARESSY